MAPAGVFMTLWALALVYPSLDNLEAAEGKYNQERLWSDCTDAQADLRFRWLHMYYCRFSHALAEIFCYFSTKIYVVDTTLYVSHKNKKNTNSLELKEPRAVLMLVSFIAAAKNKF